MGEYAKIIVGGQTRRIKIGTCSDMLYLRYDQRYSIGQAEDSINVLQCLDELWFRLPRKEEEGIKPGHFEIHSFMGAKPIAIYCERIKADGSKNRYYKQHQEDLRHMAEKNLGTIQLTSPNGIVVNVPCGHGYPVELHGGMFYGEYKEHQLGALAVGMRNGKPQVLVGCRYCDAILGYCDPEEFFGTFDPCIGERLAFEYLRNYIETKMKD